MNKILSRYREDKQRNGKLISRIGRILKHNPKPWYLHTYLRFLAEKINIGKT